MSEGRVIQSGAALTVTRGNVDNSGVNVEKSGAKSGVPMVLQPHGGALRRGSAKGNTPGPGRPRDEWKAALAALASSDEVLAHVRRVLADPDHPQWMRALEYASERGYGRVAQEVEQSGRVEVVVSYDPGGLADR